MIKKSPNNITWKGQDVKGLPVQERLIHSPEFIQAAVLKAQRLLNLKRVWVLGSRARGDATPLSDYDLVFEIDEQNVGLWAGFVADQREIQKTLLSVDWILYSQMGTQMITSLENEGILLYEKK